MHGVPEVKPETTAIVAGALGLAGVYLAFKAFPLVAPGGSNVDPRLAGLLETAAAAFKLDEKLDLLQKSIALRIAGGIAAGALAAALLASD